jgi:hypothetical protein
MPRSSGSPRASSSGPERAGEVLFRRGDPGETFYIVLAGEVTLETEDKTVVEQVRPGGFFGEIALLTGQPRSTSAVVHRDAQLAEIGRDEFQEVVMANPSVAVGMSRILGQRLANSARPPGPEEAPPLRPLNQSMSRCGTGPARPWPCPRPCARPGARTCRSS